MGTNEDVMEMVRRQLQRDPPPPTSALYGRAAHIDPDVYDLSLRQFHAKYPLRVKRERARAERDAARRDGGEVAGTGDGGAGYRGAGSSPEPTARDRVREVLYGLAREVASAEGVADLTGVVLRLADRVDEVEAILAGPRPAD